MSEIKLLPGMERAFDAAHGITSNYRGEMFTATCEEIAEVFDPRDAQWAAEVERLTALVRELAEALRLPMNDMGAEDSPWFEQAQAVLAKVKPYLADSAALAASRAEAECASKEQP